MCLLKQNVVTWWFIKVEIYKTLNYVVGSLFETLNAKQQIPCQAKKFYNIDRCDIGKDFTHIQKLLCSQRVEINRCVDLTGTPFLIYVIQIFLTKIS